MGFKDEVEKLIADKKVDEIKKIKNKFLERDIYKDLVDWKNTDDSVLFLRGPRQVGKTYLLKKLGSENFKKVVYVDLTLKKEGNKFLEIYKKFVESGEFGSNDKDKRLLWLGVFMEYDKEFTDSEDTLIIIDEIQESSSIFNSIREFNRNLNCMVAVIGSYLGVAQFRNDFRVSAGDYTVYELNSLSYVEFLKATGIYEKYKGIKEIEKNKLTVEEMEICKEVENYYDIYTQIGGYPEVVKNYLRNKNIDKCKEIVGKLLEFFFEESKAYFSDIIESTLFKKTLVLTIQDLVSRTNNLQKQDKFITFRENINESKIRKEEKIRCLNWLLTGNILGSCYVYNELNKLTITDVEKYYFKDIGMLNYLCETIGTVQKSDIDGVRAENFVYLYLNNNVKVIGKSRGISKDTSVNSYCNKNKNVEIDFILNTYNDKKVALEVKSSKGKTTSSETELSDGDLDCIIKLVKMYGGIQENKITVPIFMVDKLKEILDKI